jgi:four helix bundle protein
VAAVDGFEQLEIWKAARALTRSIYEVSSNSGFLGDRQLREQMRRAAVSVMANVAEGFERGGDKEFLQFLAQAKGSCGEVRSHLSVALDQGYLSQERHADIAEKAIQTSRMISGLMKYLRGSNFRGSKFRPKSNPPRP